MDTTVQWIPLEKWANSEQKASFEVIRSQEQTLLVCDLLEQCGFPCLLVGGVVRDLLLGTENDDVDLVVDSTPAELMTCGDFLRESAPLTPVPLDKERGILRVVFASGEELDLVARKGENLCQDLLNRDLTVNAMALSSKGELADPTGGLTDLNNRIVRMVDPGAFADDPLRVIRALRFAAQLKAKIEVDTWESLLKEAPNLSRVAGERVRVELLKFFEKADLDALSLLWECELDKHLELEKMTDGALLRDCSTSKFVTRLALWLGPVITRPKMVEERLKLSRVEGRYLQHFNAGSAWLMERSGELGIGDVYDLSLVAAEAFADLAEVLQSRHFPSSIVEKSKVQVLREAQKQGDLNWSPFPWNGHQISEAMGRQSGPWMGELLKKARKAWACGELATLEEVTSLALS